MPMPTIERWESRAVHFSYGVEGFIKTVTYTYLIDDATAAALTPQEGEECPFDNTLRLTDVTVNRHYNPDYAQLVVMYSTAGVKGPADTYVEEYFRPMGMSLKTFGYCPVDQVPIPFDSPSSRMVYGRITRQSQPDLSLRANLVGKINDSAHEITELHITMQPATMLYMSPDIGRIGEDKWRVTDEWLYEPTGWDKPVPCPTHPAYHVHPFARADMRSLLVQGAKE